jgi:hypothetical protein
MIAMAHPAVILPWSMTGTRAVSLPRRTAASRDSGARAVRTTDGFVLFDDVGRYIGVIAGLDRQSRFGPGADTVFLRRNDGF